MSTINRKKIHYPLILVLLMSFLTVFSSADVHAQKTGEKSEKKITLKKNAKKNGYKIIVHEEKIYLEAVKVVDPATKKLIEGTIQIFFRCNQNVAGIETEVTFTNGNSSRILIDCLEIELVLLTYGGI